MGIFRTNIPPVKEALASFLCLCPIHLVSAWVTKKLSERPQRSDLLSLYCSVSTPLPPCSAEVEESCAPLSAPLIPPLSPVLSSSLGTFLVLVCHRASHLLWGPELDRRSLSYCPLWVSGEREMRGIRPVSCWAVSTASPLWGFPG